MYQCVECFRDGSDVYSRSAQVEFRVGRSLFGPLFSALSLECRNSTAN
jgi:hypothetical protein